MPRAHVGAPARWRRASCAARCSGSAGPGSSASITSSGCWLWPARGRPAAALSLPGQQAVRGGRTHRARAEAARRGGAGRAEAAANSFRFRCLFLVRSRSTRRAGPSRLSGCRARSPGRASGVGGARRRSRRSRPEPSACRWRSGRRRPGDRFRPLGLRGTREAAGLSGGSENPAGERDSLPLVVDGERPDCVGRGAVGGRGFSGHGRRRKA